MYNHEVKFEWKGHVRTEIVNAHDSSDARNIISARYPGANIFSAVKRR